MAQFQPGDRVRVAMYGPNGAPTSRIATVAAQPDPDAVSVVLSDGITLVVGPDALTPLPPRERRNAPGQGRPAVRWATRVGDVLAVSTAMADGVTPLVRYTVQAVTAAGDLVLATDGGEKIIIRR